MPEQPEHTNPPQDQSADQTPASQPQDQNHSADQGIWGTNYTRREVLQKALAAGATLVGSAGALGAAKVIVDTIAPPITMNNESLHPIASTKINSPSNSELPKSPETPTAGIEFGFNTHLDNEASNMNLDLFKKCVEDLSAKGQNWIRFNFKGEFNSNPNIVSDFEQGLDFAKQKGLKVALVTDPPDLSNPQAISDFYKEIAHRFKGKVDVWQIFNEPNAHSYKDYSPRPEITPDYLKGLSQAVAAASAAIKEVDSQAKTTINLSAWVGDHRDIESEGHSFFEPISDSIDILTLDFYPDGNEEEMAKYPGYISSLKNAFGKDIMIGEIGWPTLENAFTPNDQATYMQKVMSSLQGGAVKPIAVLFYEWADEKGVTGIEGQFGANNSDGSPKDGTSYQELIQAMTPPKTDN